MEPEFESPFKTAKSLEIVSPYDPDPAKQPVYEPEKGHADDGLDKDGSAMGPNSSLTGNPDQGLDKAQLQKLLNSIRAQLELQQKQLDLLQGMCSSEVGSTKGMQKPQIRQLIHASKRILAIRKR